MLTIRDLQICEMKSRILHRGGIRLQVIVSYPNLVSRKNKILGKDEKRSLFVEQQASRIGIGFANGFNNSSRAERACVNCRA
ncbi:hypothetical protein VTO42DRAFT_3449 [Malbranchea cinnamomea]